VDVRDDACRLDLDMLSEELILSHLELNWNIVEPHQDDSHKKVLFTPCSAPNFSWSIWLQICYYTKMLWLAALDDLWKTLCFYAASLFIKMKSNLFDDLVT
jgi:hypothetical protein